MLKSKCYEFVKEYFLNYSQPVYFLKGYKCSRSLKVHHSNFISAFTRYLNTVHDVDFAPQQVWYCSFLTYGAHVTVYVSNMLILNMTFERFYSIIMPHKAASFNTVKRAKITIVCIVLFSVVFHIPHWFITGNIGRLCLRNLILNDGGIGEFYYWFTEIIHFFLPFIFFNIAVCVFFFLVCSAFK